VEGLRTGIAILLLVASASLAGAAFGWHVRQQAAVLAIPIKPADTGEVAQEPLPEKVLAPPGGIEPIDTSPVNK